MAYRTKEGNEIKLHQEYWLRYEHPDNLESMLELEGIVANIRPIIIKSSEMGRIHYVRIVVVKITPTIEFRVVSHGGRQNPHLPLQTYHEFYDTAPELADGKERLYYIHDTSRGYAGNSMLWWRFDDSGYSCDIRLARAFTEKDALSTIRGADDLRMWDKEYVDDRISWHIDMQHLDDKDPTSLAKYSRDEPRKSS